MVSPVKRGTHKIGALEAKSRSVVGSDAGLVRRAASGDKPMDLRLVGIAGRSRGVMNESWSPDPRVSRGGGGGSGGEREAKGEGCGRWQEAVERAAEAEEQKEKEAGEEGRRGRIGKERERERGREGGRGRERERDGEKRQRGRGREREREERDGSEMEREKSEKASDEGRKGEYEAYEWWG